MRCQRICRRFKSGRSLMTNYTLVFFGKEDSPLILEDVVKVTVHEGFVQFDTDVDVLYMGTAGLAFFGTDGMMDMAKSESLTD